MKAGCLVWVVLWILALAAGPAGFYTFADGRGAGMYVGRQIVVFGFLIFVYPVILMILSAKKKSQIQDLPSVEQDRKDQTDPPEENSMIS